MARKRKTTLPSKVRVMCFIYDIRYVSDLKHGDDECHGLTKYDELEILINSNLPEEIQKETLLHEIKHTIYNAVHTFREDNEKEEVFIRQHNPIEKQVFSDNKEVTRWIFDV